MRSKQSLGLISMGILSQRFKAHIGGEPWNLHMRTNGGRYFYTIEIDGDLIAEDKSTNRAADMMKPKVMMIDRKGETYRVEFGATSNWGHGVHIYHNDARIYAYKDKEFAGLPTMNRVAKWADSVNHPGGKTKSFWKDILNVMTWGLIAGLLIYPFSKLGAYFNLFPDSRDFRLGVVVGIIPAVLVLSDKVFLYGRFMSKYKADEAERSAA